MPDAYMEGERKVERKCASLCMCKCELNVIVSVSAAVHVVSAIVH